MILRKSNVPFLVLVPTIVVLVMSSCQPVLGPSNGSSFDGWEGNRSFFRVEEGALVAGSLSEPIPTNQFLCSELSFGNFELSLEVKFLSRENNGGIQIRSQRIPGDHEVIGYQSDLGYAGGNSVWGSLYDESRRNKFLAEADQELVGRVLKPDGWNHYRIRCEGARIQHWINDTQVLDYKEEDPGIALEGIICLQIHSGPPSEAWYREIEVRTL